MTKINDNTGNEDQFPDDSNPEQKPEKSDGLQDNYENIVEGPDLAQTAQDNNPPSPEIEDFELVKTPVIPQEVYDNLPAFLKENCKIFDTDRERDVFLTGAITILSGCLNEVDGIYDRKDVYPNLNCFVVAPAASGKGAFIYAKMLGDGLHNKLLEESQDQKRKYEASLRQTESNKQLDLFEDGKPPFKVLFIPGNSSAPAIIAHLSEGDERGIFCETEADTLANSINQEWGNFSDLLRKAFHHETVSLSRRANNEFVEIKRPRLSVALTGTPSQIEGIIPSAENGLFSRFIFYAFTVKPVWRSVAPVQNRPNLTEYFTTQSLEVMKMVEFLENNPTRFDLTKKQWSELDNQYDSWLITVNELLGDEPLSSIKRLGLIQFRIAMILSCLRKYQQGNKDLNVTCTDTDYKTAKLLAEVYKEHALFMFNRLPQSGSFSNKMVKQFLKELPALFKRKEAVEVGEKVGIEMRTVDKYLKQLIAAKLLTQPRFGWYKK